MAADELVEPIEPVTRVDAAGTWTSTDGVAWVLETPAAGWLPTEGTVPTPISTDERLATLIDALSTASSLAQVRQAAREATL